MAGSRSAWVLLLCSNDRKCFLGLHEGLVLFWTRAISQRASFKIRYSQGTTFSLLSQPGTAAGIGRLMIGLLIHSVQHQAKQTLSAGKDVFAQQVAMAGGA